LLSSDITAKSPLVINNNSISLESMVPKPIESPFTIDPKKMYTIGIDEFGRITELKEKK
jgi:hypothetical protein